ncbi:uncharacterized protein LOC119078746 isoform X2 [Bradysia coprophila]|uniref:uncharacterized protein LOC119078746 isoform X2 n=1 Tax=Bradysia coprophila TaxID=38358 RepID=UPI00187D9FB3|nr:uncharacterized protein LOC119078746 isoform X2 [Bradysia coprophila]
MKKCQVRSLSELALTELANTVVTAIGFAMHTELDNDITITMVDVNSYLEESGATSDIYQDMLRVILSSDFLEATVRFTCLQMLLNGSVQCLVSEIFPYSYYEKILQVIAAQGSGLTALNLKGVWVKHEHMNYMYEIMKNCTKLTKLSIPYIATDELLKYISNCKFLKILDVSGETDITEIGVEYLCLGAARERLKIVDIGTLGEENICHTDIALLLTNLPNLENLVTYSYVGQSLLCISEHHNPHFKTKLKYLHDTRTNNKTIDAIVEMCPDLESIYLDTPDSGVMHKLKFLNLRKLKIYKFCCIELEQLLENIGRNLYHLTIIKGRGTMDLGRLSRACCGLVDLDCYMMDLMTYNSDRKFDNLQGLEMLNSPFTNTALKRFVCNTRTLKRLAIDSITFTDEDMASIFLDTDFNLLEDIWFTSAPNLTVQTVELLMDRCPELQSIGQLSGWALTPDDLSLLRGMLKSANSCLRLCYRGLLQKITSAPC